MAPRNLRRARSLGYLGRPRRRTLRAAIALSDTEYQLFADAWNDGEAMRKKFKQLE